MDENDTLPQRKAERISGMLDEYGNDDTELDVIEALADIMHLCDRDGVDFDVVLATARTHYAAESHVCDDEFRSNGCTARRETIAEAIMNRIFDDDTTGD